MKRTEEEDEDEARRDDKKKVFRVCTKKNKVHFFLSSIKFVSVRTRSFEFSFVASSPRRHDERGGPRTSLSEEDDYSDDDDASEEGKYY